MGLPTELENRIGYIICMKGYKKLETLNEKIEQI